MNASSFKMRRKRTNSRVTTRGVLRSDTIARLKSKLQKIITPNKISNR